MQYMLIANSVAANEGSGTGRLHSDRDTLPGDTFSVTTDRKHAFFDGPGWR